MKKAFPIDHAVPISKAIRAGDFVFTSAFGPWVFNPANLKYDDAGNIIDDGTDNQSMSFEDQVHRTFDFIKAALAVAGCTIRAISWPSTRSTRPISNRIRRSGRSSRCASCSAARSK
jgi:enamine deaminase RidA (YjgF/YER057c/UK114 family)